MLERGTIAETDLDLFHVTDDPDEVVELDPRQRPRPRAIRRLTLRSRGRATSIRPSTMRTRVVAQATDAGQPARLGLLARRVDLRVATGRRPRRVVGAVGVEAAGRRHLDRSRRCTGRSGPRGAGRRRRSRRARRSTAARSCAGSDRRWRRCPSGVWASRMSSSPRLTRRSVPGGSVGDVERRPRTAHRAVPTACEARRGTERRRVVHRGHPIVPIRDVERRPRRGPPGPSMLGGAKGQSSADRCSSRGGGRRPLGRRQRSPAATAPSGRDGGLVGASGAGSP